MRIVPPQYGQVHWLALSYRLHRADALLAQDALHTPDSIAVAIQQMPDAAQKINILRTIIASTAAALHWPDMRETTLPKPQHVLRQVEFVCDLADRTKCVRRLVQSRLLLWVLR